MGKHKSLDSGEPHKSPLKRRVIRLDIKIAGEVMLCSEDTARRIAELLGDTHEVIEADVDISLDWVVDCHPEDAIFNEG